MAAPVRERGRTGSLLQRTASAVGGLGGRRVEVKAEGITATLALEPCASAETALAALIAKLTADKCALECQLSGSRPRLGSLGSALRTHSFGSSGGAAAAPAELPAIDSPLKADDGIADFLTLLLGEMKDERLTHPDLYKSSEFDAKTILDVKFPTDRNRNLQAAIGAKSGPEAGIIMGELIVAICRDLKLVPITEIPDEAKLPEGLHESRRTLLVEFLKHIALVTTDEETQQARLFLFVEMIFAQSEELKRVAITPIHLSQVLKRWAENFTGDEKVDVDN